MRLLLIFAIVIIAVIVGLHYLGSTRSFLLNGQTQIEKPVQTASDVKP